MIHKSTTTKYIITSSRSHSRITPQTVSPDKKLKGESDELISPIVQTSCWCVYYHWRRN
jgi:hypothetical protein